jgi:hypothetical protein
MKNLLESLDECLHSVTNFTNYTAGNCCTSLTVGGHYEICTAQRASARRGSISVGQKICLATPHLPENGTKFTKISLDVKCGWKESVKESKKPLPYNH